MKIHFDILGWLHVFVGAVGVLTGFALFVLGSGTGDALDELVVRDSRGVAVVWIFVVCGVAMLVAGTIEVLVGRAVVVRQRLGRHAVLVLGLFNLVVIPFGTALGIYSFWVMLNDDARREFGRPLRGTIHDT